MQLVASMLRHKYAMAGQVNPEALSIAYPRGIAVCWRKLLIGLLRVVPPDTAAGLKFCAWLRAWRLERPVLQLAGIRRRANIHIEKSIGADEVRMHRMVAPKR